MKTIGGQIGVEIYFRDLEVEAIIIVRPIDANRSGKGLWTVGSRHCAGSCVRQWLPVRNMHIGEQDALRSIGLQAHDIQISAIEPNLEINFRGVYLALNCMHV